MRTIWHSAASILCLRSSVVILIASELCLCLPVVIQAEDACHVFRLETGSQGLMAPADNSSLKLDLYAQY